MLTGYGAAARHRGTAVSGAYCACGAPQPASDHDCALDCAAAWLARHDLDPDAIGDELLRQWARQRPRWPNSVTVRQARIDFQRKQTGSKGNVRVYVDASDLPLASPGRDLALAVDLGRLSSHIEPIAAACLDGMTTREAAQEHHVSAPTAWRRWASFQHKAMEVINVQG